MNKNELVASVSEASGLSKVDAAKAVDGVFESITGALKSGGDVRIYCPTRLPSIQKASGLE